MKIKLFVANRAWVLCSVAITACACAPREAALPERPPVNRRARVTHADIVGCYRVEIGQWQPAIDRSASPDIHLTFEEIPEPRVGHGAVKPSWAQEHRLHFRDQSDREFSHNRKCRLAGPSDVELWWNIALRARVTVDRRSRNLSGTVSYQRSSSEPKLRAHQVRAQALLTFMSILTRGRGVGHQGL